MHLYCYDYVFCNEHAEETLRHLFWDCAFLQDCWNSIIPNKKPGISYYDDDDIYLAQLLLRAPIAMDIIIQGAGIY